MQINQSNKHFEYLTLELFWFSICFGAGLNVDDAYKHFGIMHKYILAVT